LNLPAKDLIDGLAALLVTLDGDGTIVFWNRRLEEVTGFGRDEMIGTGGRTLVAGSGPVPLPVKGGGHRLVRWECSDQTDRDGRVLTFAVGTDVTDQQETLARTVRAERLAAVGTLASGLAHEVRNPLNAALLQLTVLKRRLDRPDYQPGTLEPIIAAIRHELERLDRLVDDFIAFAQPRPLDLRPTDVASLCRTVVAHIAREIEAARVRLNLELPEGRPDLHADPERLQHVLLNLVRNALEAMPGGGELTFRLRTDPAGVEIDVADTGVGFPAGAPVFDAFFTTKPNGTGLGLSVVHRIVSDHGGTVSVRSSAGGTCFTIALPATVTSPIAATDGPAKPASD
jgi:signal transduction histidine kinase